MSNIDKQALRQLATDAHELGIIKRYTKGIEANKIFVAIATPLTVLALLDELETKEEQRANWFQMAQKLGEDLDAAEKRIAELKEKLANPVLLPKTNGYWTEQEKAYEEAITLAKRQVRLAGFRCEGDE
ncbi:ead/Ea22-like family protein [Citrobacter freundii]